MTQSKTQQHINFKTGKAYFGANEELLTQVAAEKGFDSNEWATMKQWNSANEVIRKNEKGTRIDFTDRKGDEVSAFLFNRNQLA